MSSSSDPAHAAAGPADVAPDVTPDVAAVADAFFAAIEAADIDAIRALYHPDARIWHNFDQIEQSVDENVKVLRSMARTLADRRYDDVRRIVLDDGFVQQHVLRGTTPRGELDMPAMMRVWVADGLVTRVEEYLDPAPAALLRG